MTAGEYDEALEIRAKTYGEDHEVVAETRSCWINLTPTPMPTSDDHIMRITRFYEAFQRQDAEEMAACYHPDVVFSDPAFGELHGKEVGAMWAMLLERAKGDLDVTFADVTAAGDRGTAHWEAKYRFGQSGRMVHNKIDAAFQFEDGLIIEHRDSFSMREWLGMALGAYAGAPGLNRVFATVVRNKVRSALSDYMGGRE